MADKLFLNFGEKLRLSAKMALKFFWKNAMNGDVRAAKDTLENLKIRKTTSKWILTDVFRKIQKLVNSSQNLCSELFSAWSCRLQE